MKPLTDNLLELHPAGIVFGDEVIQSVPTPTNSHHHVVPQDLKIEHRYQEVEERIICRQWAVIGGVIIGICLATI